MMLDFHRLDRVHRIAAQAVKLALLLVSVGAAAQKASFIETSGEL